MFFHVKHPTSSGWMLKEVGEEMFQAMQLTPLDFIFCKIYWIRLCGAGFKFHIRLLGLGEGRNGSLHLTL